MSTNVYSCAIFGIQVNGDKLQEAKKMTRNCDCEVKNIKIVNFCPNCGKQFMRTETSDISAFNRDKETLCDYPVFMDSDNNMVYIGIKTRKVDPLRGQSFSSSSIPDDVKEYKKKMRDTLIPLGLWDENKFGIWVSSWVSG
jgi:predicted RNA-binding Zn-ribbon protein involved in translation (DUF1610 family)